MTLPAPVPLCEICHVKVLTTLYEKKQHACLECGREQRIVNKYRNKICKDLVGFTAEINNRKVGAPDVREIAETMASRLGGVEGFVELWVSQVREACSRNPGGKTALDGMRAIWAMFKEAHASQNTAPEKMSNEDIEAELQGLMSKMLGLTVDVEALEAPEETETKAGDEAGANHS